MSVLVGPRKCTDLTHKPTGWRCLTDTVCCRLSPQHPRINTGYSHVPGQGRWHCCRAGCSRHGASAGGPQPEGHLEYSRCDAGSSTSTSTCRPACSSRSQCPSLGPQQSTPNNCRGASVCLVHTARCSTPTCCQPGQSACSKCTTLAQGS